MGKIRVLSRYTNNAARMIYLAACHVDTCTECQEALEKGQRLWFRDCDDWVERVSDVGGKLPLIGINPPPPHWVRGPGEFLPARTVLSWVLGALENGALLRWYPS